MGVVMAIAAVVALFGLRAGRQQAVPAAGVPAQAGPAEPAGSTGESERTGGERASG